MQRNRQPPPGVQSRSREMLSPESVIGSANSNCATPVRQASPAEQVMSPASDPMTANGHEGDEDNNLFCIGGELLSPDEAIMTLRDRLMSPSRAMGPMQDGIPPGAHAIPESSGPASTYRGNSDQASRVAEASSASWASRFSSSRHSGSNHSRSTYNESRSRLGYILP